MATTPIKKLSDYLTYNPILNPSGGFPAGGLNIAKTTPATLLNGPTGQAAFPAAPTPVQAIAPPRAALPPPSLVPPATPAPVAPIFSGSNPSGAPVGPQGATGAAPANQVPSQYLNPDGSFKTPDQIASEVGGALANAHGQGDVGKLALAQFGGNNQTTAQAEAEARRITNTRNDIASGETDPYKVASQSGIAYTPAELNAIEQAYAGVYEPALDTALAKVTDKQAADKAKAAADAEANKPFTLGKDDVRYDGQGNPIAVGVGSGNGGSGAIYVAGQNPVVDSYVQGFKSGQYKASDIPDAYKDLVSQGIAQSTSSGKLSPTSTTAIGIINELQNLDLGTLSGQGIIGGIEHPSSLFPGTAVQTTQNLAKQLQATISLANRQQLKGSGAISDFEFKVLGDAATALGLDGNGRTNLSPTDFKDQLGKLEVRLQVGPVSLPDDEVQYLSTQGYTPDQIREYDQSQSGFSSVGNTSASTQVSVGNRPQRNNNPGNVKAGGVSDSLAIGTDDQGHLIFPDAKAGFQALTADLTAKVNGASKYLPANPTIAQLGKVYAEDPNWPKKVAQILGVPVDTHTQAIPIAQLAKAVATQEGFYA